jgi:hypothetical protein
LGWNAGGWLGKWSSYLRIWARSLNRSGRIISLFRFNTRALSQCACAYSVSDKRSHKAVSVRTPSAMPGGITHACVRTGTSRKFALACSLSLVALASLKRWRGRSTAGPFH